MFLSAHDLIVLTGVRQKAAQRRWLARNGVSFFIRADGGPAVIWESLDSSEAPSKAHRASGPDFSALDRLA